MLLELGNLGVELDIREVPTPNDVPIERWFNCFPCFGFLLTCETETTDACVAAFETQGLSASRVGTLDETGIIRLRSGAEVVSVLDVDGVTGISRG